MITENPTFCPTAKENPMDRAARPLRTHVEPAPLRFGVLCGETLLQAWQLRCLETLLTLDDVHLALLIRIAPSDTARTPTGEPKIIDFQHRLYHFCRRYVSRPSAIRPLDCCRVTAGTPALHCKTRYQEHRGHLRQFFAEADVHAISRHGLDFILDFGSGLIGGAILHAAHLGIWSFLYGDPAKYHGEPPCFWEIYHDDPVTAATLYRILDGPDDGAVLQQGFLKTLAHSYSGNVDRILQECALWPAQVCQELRHGSSPPRHAPALQVLAPLVAPPTNLQILRFAFKILRNLWLEIRQTLFRHPQWHIGIVQKPIQTFLNPGFKPRVKYLEIPGKDRFLADPFGIWQDNCLVILCEEFDFRSFKGVISSIVAEDGVRPSRHRVVMDLPIHLSYPCLIRHQGEIYCIPETARAREVALYLAEEFPVQWRKVATLIRHVAAIDPTVFQFEEHWWLACTDREKGAHFKLSLWYAQDLTGPWKPHPGNPVKIDIRSSRPAGTPFVHDGCLYRPAQDCSRAYGSAMVLNRIIRLTPEEFREEPAVVLRPDADGPYPDGVHTLSAAGNLTLIDGNRFTFNAAGFKHVLKRELAGLFTSRSPRQG
jgi:hypothetical protein